MKIIPDGNQHGKTSNPLDGARRAYRRLCAKDPRRPALVPGSGRLVANGVLRAELHCIDDSTVTFIARPRTEWAYELAPNAKRHSLSPQMEASLSDRARAAFNTVLDILVRAEQHTAPPIAND